MMDNQKEWQKPPNPETEEKIGGHSSQPWRHVDQMFPATRWWLWFLIQALGRGLGPHPSPSLLLWAPVTSVSSRHPANKFFFA